MKPNMKITNVGLRFAQPNLRAFRDATQGLSKGQKRIVHEQITGRNLSYQEIKEIAKEVVKNGG